MIIKSFINQLKDDLINLETITYQLLDKSSINEFRNDPNSGVFIIAPPYYWGELTSDGETIQAKAITLMDELMSRFDMLFDGKPITILNRYDEIKKYFIGVIKRESRDWCTPASLDEAKIKLKEVIQETNTLLDWLEGLGNKDTVIVPDTNALIINHKLESYGQILGDIEKWTIVITPTVLKELDELKIKNTGNEFKEKVKNTIRYIKGLRAQGDVINGVQIFNKKVTIRLQAIEPNMNKTLPWLDSSNNDDRIIASCFDIQVRNPSLCVIIMTADLNLQTKAQLAGIPFIEPNDD